MKDIWGEFLGKTLTGVIHVDRPDSGVVCQVFLAFIDEDGEESHVEIYSNYADFRWSSARVARRSLLPGAENPGYDRTLASTQTRDRGVPMHCSVCLRVLTTVVLLIGGLASPTLTFAQAATSPATPADDSSAAETPGARLERMPAGEPDESLRQLQIYFLQESERLRQTARVEYGLGVLFSVASATLAVIGAGGSNDNDGMLLAAGVAGFASVVSTTVGLFTDTNAHKALEKAVQLEVTGRLDLPRREEPVRPEPEPESETPRRFQKSGG